MRCIWSFFCSWLLATQTQGPIVGSICVFGCFHCARVGGNDVKISLYSTNHLCRRRRLLRYLDRNDALIPANTVVENVESNNVCACVRRQRKVSAVWVTVGRSDCGSRLKIPQNGKKSVHSLSLGRRRSLWVSYRVRITSEVVMETVKDRGASKLHCKLANLYIPFNEFHYNPSCGLRWHGKEVASKKRSESNPFSNLA